MLAPNFRTNNNTGFFNKAMNFFGEIGEDIIAPFSYVGEGVYNTFGTIHEDAKDYLSGVKQVIVGGEKAVGDSIQGIGSISTPLLVGGGILGLALLMRK